MQHAVGLRSPFSPPLASPHADENAPPRVETVTKPPRNRPAGQHRLSVDCHRTAVTRTRGSSPLQAIEAASKLASTYGVDARSAYADSLSISADCLGSTGLVLTPGMRTVSGGVSTQIPCSPMFATRGSEGR